MSKFSFKDYEDEIKAVSRAQGVDLGVAYDMFRADVRSGRNENCGACLAAFDFAAAKAEWDALTSSEQAAAYQEWHRK